MGGKGLVRKGCHKDLTNTLTNMAKITLTKDDKVYHILTRCRENVECNSADKMLSVAACVATKDFRKL